MTFPFKYLSVTLLALFIVFSAGAVAQAEILYDGADTSGVTTDDQYVIDYDDTSTTNINLNFGSAGTNYLRFDLVNGRFQISDDLDLQSAQLINARTQNVSVLADVPACAAAGDRGKKIFTGGSTIASVNGAQTLAANTEYVCNDTNAAASRWVATTGGGGDADTLDTLDSLQFLRSDTSDNYTSGTLQFDAGTTVTFTGTTTVNLPNTTANTFTVNNDAAGGDSSVLSFGDGSGNLTWNDTAGNFTFNNSLTVTGTTTTNSLVVNAAGTVDLNNNQVLDLRLENVASLPACSVVGRVVYLTTQDGTNPPGEYVCDGTTWRKSSIDNTNMTLIFAPVYEDSVNRPDGSNNVGTLSSDYDSTNTRNFYRWSSSGVTLQDLDIVLDIRLPDDFKSFQATNPIQLDYRTNTTSAADNQIDVTGFDTGGTALTLSNNSDLVSGTADTWASTNIGITGGTFTAGSRMQLIIKPQSKLTTLVQRPADVGSLRLNYVRKSP